MAVETREITEPVETQVEPTKDIAPSKKRRRPSGEAPPLPRQLRASGKYWLGLAIVALGCWILIFFVDGVSAAVTRVDLAILRGISDVRSDPLTDLMRWVHSLGSEWVIGVLRWGTILVLLFFKRFRHLFVFLGSVLGVGFVCTVVTQNIVRARPRWDRHLGHWEGAAHPSRPVAAVAATLIGISYSLVPPGRPRWWAKWISGLLIGALALRPPVPGRRPPHRRDHRDHRRCHDPSGRVPDADAERCVPRLVQEEDGRSPRCRRTTRRRHLDGGRGAVRHHDHRRAAVQPRGVGRLDAAEADRSGGAAGGAVREALRRGTTSERTGGTRSAAPCCTDVSRTRAPSRRFGAWCNTRTTCCV